MIVRRQPTVAGDQLSFDDLDGWRFHAISTEIPPMFANTPPPPATAHQHTSELRVGHRSGR
jgi:hypothetical protein